MCWISRTKLFYLFFFLKHNSQQKFSWRSSLLFIGMNSSPRKKSSCLEQTQPSNWWPCEWWQFERRHQYLKQQWWSQRGTSFNYGHNPTAQAPGNQSELQWIDRTKWSRPDCVLQSPLTLPFLIHLCETQNHTSYHWSDGNQIPSGSILRVDSVSILQCHTDEQWL